MFNNSSSSSPTISNTIFQGNSASQGQGGGMYNNFSSPTISNTTFQGNSALSGGGMFHNYSSPTISNTTFQGNSAYYGGGGMFNNYSFPSIKNVIFWENKKNNANNIAGADVENSNIFTPAISYSLTQAGSIYSSGTGIINNQDPLFVDAANGFLQLKCNSPAINSGTLTGAPLDDITGFTRVGNPDMGAYEFNPTVLINNITVGGTNPYLSGIPILRASSQILNTNNVLYQGSNNVQLLPGFSVAPAPGQATVFRAEIGGGCP